MCRASGCLGFRVYVEPVGISLGLHGDIKGYGAP